MSRYPGKKVQGVDFTIQKEKKLIVEISKTSSKMYIVFFAYLVIKAVYLSAVLNRSLDLFFKVKKCDYECLSFILPGQMPYFINRYVI